MSTSHHTVLGSFPAHHGMAEDPLQRTWPEPHPICLERVRTWLFMGDSILLRTNSPGLAPSWSFRFEGIERSPVWNPDDLGAMAGSDRGVPSVQRPTTGFGSDEPESLRKPTPCSP